MIPMASNSTSSSTCFAQQEPGWSSFCEGRSVVVKSGGDGPGITAAVWPTRYSLDVPTRAIVAGW